MSKRNFDLQLELSLRCSLQMRFVLLRTASKRHLNESRNAQHKRKLFQLLELCMLTVGRRRLQVLVKILVNGFLVFVRLNQQGPRTEVHGALELAVGGILGVETTD